MTCEILVDVVVRIMNEGKAMLVHTAVFQLCHSEVRLSHTLLGLLPGV